MVRALFEALESSLGPRVDGLGQLVWGLGAALVGWTFLAPWARAVLDGRVAGAGLVLGWTVLCPRCGARTPVRSGPCESCGAPFPLPAGVRWFARLAAPGTPARGGRGRWILVVLGAGSYGVATLLLALNSGALAPLGRVERLFAGAALLAWAGVGLLLGRLLSPRGLRLVERLEALVFAAAAAVALVASLAVAQAARPVEVLPVALLEGSADAVTVDGQRLAAPGGEVTVEYQLVEARGLGLVHLSPLAVVAAQGRVTLQHGRVEAFLLQALWERAQPLAQSGVVVRRLSEQFQLAPGTRSQLVAKERELSLQNVP